MRVKLRLALGGIFVALWACGDSAAPTITIDGSSTVYPISSGVAEEFMKAQGDAVHVTVGVSGTGGGFKKFCIGETDISDASRPIKGSEITLAAEHQVAYIELPVAYDGLSVVVSKQNTFIDHLTLDEMKRLFSLEGGVKTWKDLRADWPDREVVLYTPGTDSGTFDYFKEVVLGKDGKFRQDASTSEDDNTLVQGVRKDPYALGFFGFAYYINNQEHLKAVPIDGGQGPVSPTLETIERGSYSPLSRPVLIYISAKAAKRREVVAFIDFYLKNAPKLVAQVGYIPLPAAVYEAAKKRFAARKTGTVYVEGADTGDLAKLFGVD